MKNQPQKFRVEAYHYEEDPTKQHQLLAYIDDCDISQWKSTEQSLEMKCDYGDNETLLVSNFQKDLESSSFLDYMLEGC